MQSEKSPSKRKCLVCGNVDRPMTFQNEDYCCELCRKKLHGEVPLTEKDLQGIDRYLTLATTPNGTFISTHGIRDDWFGVGPHLDLSHI